MQEAISELLKEDYFKRRIAYYKIEKEGVFALFLRKHKQGVRKRGCEEKDL